MKKNTSLLFFFKHKYVQLLYIHVFSSLVFLFSEKTNKYFLSPYLKIDYSKVFSDIIELLSINLHICQGEKVLIRHCDSKNNSHNSNWLVYHA